MTRQLALLSLTEPMSTELRHRIRDIRQGSDELLCLFTDENLKDVLKIEQER